MASQTLIDVIAPLRNEHVTSLPEQTQPLCLSVKPPAIELTSEGKLKRMSISEAMPGCGDGNLGAVDRTLPKESSHEDGKSKKHLEMPKGERESALVPKKEKLDDCQVHSSKDHSSNQNARLPITGSIKNCPDSIADINVTLHHRWKEMTSTSKALRQNMWTSAKCEEFINQINSSRYLEGTDSPKFGKNIYKPIMTPPQDFWRPPVEALASSKGK